MSLKCKCLIIKLEQLLNSVCVCVHALHSLANVLFCFLGFFALMFLSQGPGVWSEFGSGLFFSHGCYKPAGREERFIKLAAPGHKCDGNFV